MNLMRHGLLLILLLTISAVFAENLPSFYDSLYVAEDVKDITSALTRLLDSDATIEEIDEAIGILNSFNPDMIREYLNQKMAQQSRSFNYNSAWILAGSNADSSLTAARRLIKRHKRNPDAYKLLVMTHLKYMPEASDAPAWAAYQRGIQRDKGILKRFAKRHPTEKYAQYGALLLALSKGDTARANAAIDALLGMQAVINIDCEIKLSFADPHYRRAIVRYMRGINPELFPPQSSEFIGEMAINLVSYMIEQEAWRELYDSFYDQTIHKELGVVMIGLLRACDKLDLYDSGYMLLAEDGLEVAIDIIRWWMDSYPEDGLNDFLTDVREHYPVNEITEAVLILAEESPEIGMEKSKAFINKYPERYFGYQNLMWAFTPLLQNVDYDEAEFNDVTAHLPSVLSSWDRFSELSWQDAINSVIEMLQTLYGAEQYAKVIQISKLRGSWLENPAVQYLVINSLYNQEDYAGVMALLQKMVDNGIIGTEALLQLQNADNIVSKQEGWDELMRSAEAKEITNPEIIEE